MNGTVTIGVHDFRRVIQYQMAIEILRDFVETREYVTIEEVKRILNAIDED